MDPTERGTERDKRHAANGTGWALGLGRVFGIPIRLHFTFLLLLVWIAWATPGPNRWWGMLYVVGLFACVVLHELGHSVIAQRLGIRVAEIVLYPIGGVSRMERLPRASQELWITIAGPGVNVVIAILIYAGLVIAGALVPWSVVRLGGPHFWQNLLAANVLLFLFNLIPAFPMDGGRILRALLALKLGELRATEIAAGVGQALAILFGFVGLLVFFNPILILIAFFVYLGAAQEAGMYRGRALVQGLTASAAMITDFHTLQTGATLRQAADLLLQSSQQDFPIVNGPDVVGVLSRQDLLRGLATEGPQAYVAEAMDRDFLSVPPTADLQELAAEMQTGGNAMVLVMMDGQLLGMITPDNLSELLAVRRLTTQSRDRDIYRKSA